MSKVYKKAFQSEKFSSWFVPDQNTHNTRRKVNTAKNAQARTQRFKNSALPYMTRILNDPHLWTTLVWMYLVENSDGHGRRISSACRQDTYETV